MDARVKPGHDDRGDAGPSYGRRCRSVWHSGGTYHMYDKQAGLWSRGGSAGQTCDAAQKDSMARRLESALLTIDTIERRTNLVAALVEAMEREIGAGRLKPG